MDIEQVARLCHEVNRAYCEAIGDQSQVAWEDAANWQRESAIKGVESVYSGVAKTPADQHRGWMEEKIKTGWVYGPVKDAVAKTHPCMVEYEDLPQEQKVKDYLFRAVVKSCNIKQT